MIEKERTGIIYRATSPSGKVYIGQTVLPLLTRIIAHYSLAKQESREYKFMRALRKYGGDIYWQALHRDVPESHLNDLEYKEVQRYDSFYNGYNCTKGGDSVSEKCTGERCHTSKLTVKVVNEIRELYMLDAYTQKELGEMHGVTHGTIGRALKNKTWRDETYGFEAAYQHRKDIRQLKEKITKVSNPGLRRGEEHGNSKLTPQQVKEIRKKYTTSDVSTTKLAVENGVSSTTIHQIVNNKAWKEPDYVVLDWTELHRRKRSRANSGKTHTEETKQKLSKVLKGHTRSMGENNGRSKLSWGDVRDIREKYVPRKYTYEQLAKEHGVTRGLIGMIVRDEIWKEKE